MSEVLIALAERVEAARGADRRIDRDIFQVIDLGGRVLTDDETNIRTTEARRGSLFLAHIKPYTASLDAAMTLAPEGWVYIEHVRYDDGSFGCRMEVVGVRIAEIESSAATPALALTAAALRAIAARTS